MKLLPTVFLGSFVFLTSVASAQEMFSAGAGNQSMAGASVCLSGCWSVFGNQAGLAEIDRVEIAGSFQNRFLIRELSTRSGILVFPVQSSVFAVSLSQFGENPYRQEKFGLSYARRLYTKLSFGVQFNYYRLFLSEDSRSAGAAGLELGIQYRLTDQLIAGFHLLNPYQTGIPILSGTFWYPSRLNLGLRVLLSDSFNIAAELENDFSQLFLIRTGLEYIILENMYLRAGFSGKPYQLAAGIGFRHRRLSVDLASSYHQYLGDSPSVSFQYQF